MVGGRGRSRVRFGAVLVAVVLALTGFSTSGGSSGKKSSGGGGGCSSSKSSKKSRSSSSGSDKGYRSTASPSPSATGAVATAVVTSCGDASRPSTTVEVTSLLGRKATFDVSVYREEAGGALIETASGKITLDARATGTTDIAMTRPGRAGDVAKCRIGSVHVVADASPTPDSGIGKPGSQPGSKSTPKATPKPNPKTTKPRT